MDLRFWEMVILPKKLNVQAAKFTDGAAQKITAAGGTIEVK